LVDGLGKGKVLEVGNAFVQRSGTLDGDFVAEECYFVGSENTLRVLCIIRYMYRIPCFILVIITELEPGCWLLNVECSW
jgi:hypothetical protein